MVRCTTLSDGNDSPANEANSDFNEFGNDKTADATTADAETKGGSSLEDELNQAEGKPSEPVAQQQTDQPAAEPTPAPVEDEFAQFDQQAQPTPTPEEKPQMPVVAQESPPAVVDTPIEPPPPEVAPEVVPPPVVETAPPAEEAAPSQKLAQIKNIRYKANDNGGTVLVEADQALTYETRLNADTNQFVIEIPNAKLPDKLKRPFNTRDMTGGIGSIDAYQNKGSNTARIVVQLRSGVTEPTVQAEGNSLLIVQTGGAPATEGNGIAAAAKDSSSAASPDVGGSHDNATITVSGTSGAAATSESKILSSASLEEFMAGNSQFYGKPISVEVSEMDVREVFKLIGEESGINMVLADEVKGTISLKLREVPWDQALIVIMKARRLGYTRSGSILRIAPLADIKSEEDETLRMIAARKAQVPLKVRVIPVSYAKIDDVEKQVGRFLSERGKAVGDTRTSSLIVSDHDENIDRVAKLVASIDVPPPQVLIEGKIVEASDQFQRQIGINWSASGQEYRMFNSNKIRGRSTLGVSPTTAAGIASTGNLTFTLGTIDILGDLAATLALYENQSSVKVLSSPRIVTLHNEPAEINQSIDIPLLSETVTPQGTSRTVTFKPVTLKLGVTPQITNDASVIMAIDVKRDFVGSVVDQSTQSRPINTRSAKTKVMVRNSQTAVIGGIYQSDQTIGESKVPWVADVPILGWLFKNRNNDSNKNELLIFLTPRILGQADSQAIPSENQGIIE
jgi:type IV pilus assembly protein PilQ